MQKHSLKRIHFFRLLFKSYYSNIHYSHSCCVSLQDWMLCTDMSLCVVGIVCCWLDWVAIHWDLINSSVATALPVHCLSCKFFSKNCISNFFNTDLPVQISYMCKDIKKHHNIHYYIYCKVLYCKCFFTKHRMHKSIRKMN